MSDNNPINRSTEKQSDLFPKAIKYFILTISILEIVFLSITFVLVICGKVSQEAFMGATLSMGMSNVIAIIGIAVALWAGLNIANAVQKKDITEAVEKANDAEKVSNSAMKKAEEATPVLNEIKLLNKEVEQARKTEFLIEIEKLTFDELSKWLLRQMQQRADLDPKPRSWGHLVALEREFRLVDLSYRDSETKIKDKVLINNIITGCTERYQEFAKSVEDSFLKSYATVRLADLFYYKGKLNGGKEAYKNTISLYKNECLLKDFFGSSSSLEQLADSMASAQPSDLRNLVAYFCNTIGDAYKELGDYDSAIRYCRNAVTLSYHNIDAMETYQRNYGCALEGKYSLTLIDSSAYREIMLHYTEAAKVMYRKKNVKARASLADKYVNTIMSLPLSVDLSSDTTGNHFSDQSIAGVLDKIRDINDDMFFELESANELIGDLSQTAISMFPRDSLGYIYDAVFARNVYLISKALGREFDFSEVRIARNKLINMCPRAIGFPLLIINDLDAVIEYEKNSIKQQND